MIQKVIVVVIQKLKIDVFQNPVIPPLNIYPNGVSSFYREICSVTFIAVLFIEAGNWRQPICLSVDEKMKKLLQFTNWNITPSLTQMEIMKFIVK